MKSKIKWILLATGLVVVIAGAAVLYRVLSANYSGENLMQSAQAQEQSAQESEFAAPDFTVYDGDGNEVHLSDYKGKPVVLNFWRPGAITARRKCRISTGRMKNTRMCSSSW